MAAALGFRFLFVVLQKSSSLDSHSYWLVQTVKTVHNLPALEHSKHFRFQLPLASTSIRDDSGVQIERTPGWDRLI